ncbi:hypothetical protein [Nostoc sp. NMS8]|uniref:hypothetical protein n=1 Tax=Nostoc sp. NMS8 TaxID=2815392 RepID=UPI0025DD41C6|nr:hypothetical protein [Nostoc sp. NMS8]MBN3958139.1 hypothetical protein [Nostoc sp. NMS8]
MTNQLSLEQKSDRRYRYLHKKITFGKADSSTINLAKEISGLPPGLVFIMGIPKIQILAIWLMIQIENW